MNQNNKHRQLSVFEIDANDDETDVVFLDQAYAYHQQFVAEENRLPLTRNLINPAIRQLAYGTTPDAFDEYLQMTRANKDINVLDNSPLFDGLLNDTSPVVPYVVNGVGYEKGYYLADGIYPQWATFVKSFTVANDAKHAYYKKRQEGARKDAKLAFGVLQGRWGIIQQPARSYHVNTLRRVMYSCIILHNKILKDQKMAVFD
nr:protein ALP1-like [Tanacetum cinerariifolium]